MLCSSLYIFVKLSKCSTRTLTEFGLEALRGAGSRELTQDDQSINLTRPDQEKVGNPLTVRSLVWFFQQMITATQHLPPQLRYENMRLTLRRNSAVAEVRA